MRSFLWLIRPTIFLLFSFGFLLLIISIYLVLNSKATNKHSILNTFNSLNFKHVNTFPESEKTSSEEINILFLFNNAVGNKMLQNSFTLCLTSLFAKVSNLPALHFYIVGDVKSYELAKMLIHNISHEMDSHHQPAVTYQNYSHLQGNTFDIIQRVHQQLSSGKDHQFSSPLFYLSIVLHKILPRNISKIIVFDIDLIIDSDIVKLFALFDDFSFEQAIGIARENQPVYQNVFWEYRKNNPKTRVGEPPPDGLTGFNSGVVLLDLHKLQQSSKYNVFFTENKLITLVKKYHFQGHLGDQDFFTLLSFESEELFYILPCGWNRQLCTWWKRNGFSDSFDLFYNCSGPVHIWHGNCKTSLLNYTSH